MELFEYIKKNYKTPNPFVVKGLGGSEELVEYLRKTPWNTNLNVVGSITNSSGDQGEVWASTTSGETEIDLVVTPSETSGPGMTTKQYDDWKDLFVNSSEYSVTAIFKTGDEMITEELTEGGSWSTSSVSNYAVIICSNLDLETAEIWVEAGSDEPMTEIQIIVTHK